MTLRYFVRAFKYKDTNIYKRHTDVFAVICGTKLSRKLEGSTRRQFADWSIANTRKKCMMEIAVNIVVCNDTIIVQMTFND